MTGGDVEVTLCAVNDCPHETDGARLCSRCVSQLAVRLREVPGLAEELEVTITKQDKLGARGGGGGRSDEPPLMFNLGASDARGHLREILFLWAGDVAGRSGERIGVPPGREAWTTAAEWLLGHLRAVSHHPAAEDLYEEVTEAVWAAVKAIDRPPDREFVGWCCTALYVRPGAAMVTCRECETGYVVDVARRRMLDRMSYLVGTATQVSRYLTAAGVNVTPARIRLWAHRGKLGQLPGRRYRLGDVVAVAAGG